MYICMYACTDVELRVCMSAESTEAAACNAAHAGFRMIIEADSAGLCGGTCGWR